MNQNKELLIQLKDILKQKGMKYTVQRAIILEILFNLNDHLSAEDIHNIIKNNYPDSNIGIATVYRTLNFLEEADLVSSISFGTDGKKYEGKTKTHHDHLICTGCGKIIEFFDNEIENRQEKIARNNGFEITGHSMQIYGLCKNCKKDISKN